MLKVKGKPEERKGDKSKERVMRKERRVQKVH